LDEKADALGHNSIQAPARGTTFSDHDDGRGKRFPPSDRIIARFHLLGPFRALNLDGQQIEPKGRKARAMLSYLCLARHSEVSRSRIAGLLWDRVSEQQARSSLRQALADVNAAFTAAGLSLLDPGRESIRLNMRRCWVDVNAVMNHLVDKTAAEEIQLLDSCNGRLLEDLDGLSESFDDWLAAERASVETRLVGMQDAMLCRLAVEGAEPARRAKTARRLLQLDPVHEGAWRELIRATAQQGEPAQAIRIFEQCRTTLKKLVDMEPSAETTAVAAAIRLSHPRSPGRGAAREGFQAPEDQVEANETDARFQALPPFGSSPGGLGQTLRWPARASRLRLGVLPFLAIGPLPSGDLPLALAQETAGALARFRWFDVISPVALGAVRSAAYWPEALRQSRLGYAVDGTIGVQQDRLTLTVFLLDLEQHASPIWSTRVAAEPGCLSERVTAHVVAQLDPAILFIEGTRSEPRPDGSATGAVLRAIPMLFRMDRASYEQAGRMLAAAVAAEPDNAMAAAWTAFWHVFQVGQGWSPNPREAFIKAEQLCISAIRLDPGNAEALGIYGHCCAFMHHDFESAEHYFGRALEMNPSLAFVWALSAPTFCYIGRPDEALRRLERYRTLAPADPHFRLFETIYTVVHTFAGDYERAAAVGRRSVRANPEFTNGYKPLLASLGHLGRREEASVFLQALLRLEPGFSIVTFARSYPFGRAEDRERYLAGLRAAGVPET
jgi:DNA-binding SARP family transcriptional activator/TolB-like protein/Tfp pilus assembly protein PilF